jgi:hypothetical protein
MLIYDSELVGEQAISKIAYVRVQVPSEPPIDIMANECIVEL